MLQNPTASTITTAKTVEHVWKIYRIMLTRARARYNIPASTVKLVSTVR